MRLCFTKKEKKRPEAEKVKPEISPRPEGIIESFILISHPVNPSQTQYIMVILC